MTYELVFGSSMMASFVFLILRGVPHIMTDGNAPIGNAPTRTCRDAQGIALDLPGSANEQARATGTLSLAAQDRPSVPLRN